MLSREQFNVQIIQIIDWPASSSETPNSVLLLRRIGIAHLNGVSGALHAALPTDRNGGH